MPKDDAIPKLSSLMAKLSHFGDKPRHVVGECHVRGGLLAFSE
jgi:hypothetical protein